MRNITEQVSKYFQNPRPCWGGGGKQPSTSSSVCDPLKRHSYKSCAYTVLRLTLLCHKSHKPCMSHAQSVNLYGMVYNIQHYPNGSYSLLNGEQTCFSISYFCLENYFPSTRFFCQCAQSSCNRNFLQTQTGSYNLACLQNHYAENRRVLPFAPMKNSCYVMYLKIFKRSPFKASGNKLLIMGRIFKRTKDS